MKIAHVTSVHAPDDVRIYHKQCLSLTLAGHDVTVIAATDRSIDLSGVALVPVARPRGRAQRLTATQWHILRRAIACDADVYHLHDPELIPIGLVLRCFGKRVVYDVHEDLPRAVLSKHWIPIAARPTVSHVASFAESIALKSFSGIVAATPGIARRFQNGSSALVQNFPLRHELATGAGLPYQERRNDAIFVGGISALRGAREMAHAITLLPEQYGARLRLAGPISTRLSRELEQIAPPGKVELLGQIPRADLGPLMGSARMGLVLFHPAPNHVEAQPNKLFEYMSAGLPVIASDFPLWRATVEDIGCGLLADPQNPEAIAAAIRYLLDHEDEAADMGRRGLQAVQERLNWDAEAEKLLAFYEAL